MTESMEKLRTKSESWLARRLRQSDNASSISGSSFHDARGAPTQQTHSLVSTILNTIHECQERCSDDKKAHGGGHTLPTIRDLGLDRTVKACVPPGRACGRRPRGFVRTSDTRRGSCVWKECVSVPACTCRPMNVRPGRFDGPRGHRSRHV